MIPNDLVMPNNIFDLIIQNSDGHNMTSTVVRAEYRWSDLNYSETHIKIGFKLNNNSISQCRAINHIVKQASMMENISFKCSLIF